MLLDCMALMIRTDSRKTIQDNDLALLYDTPGLTARQTAGTADACSAATTHVVWAAL
jgi:hypothetical protein